MTEKEFISEWINKISKEQTKKFPDDFINFKNANEIELPKKTLVIGQQFFGSFEVITVNGTLVLHAESHDKAKYIIYANKEKPAKIKIPQEESEIKKAVSEYEKYLDSIIKQIETDYKKKFPGMKNSAGVVNEIFRVSNFTRY